MQFKPDPEQSLRELSEKQKQGHAKALIYYPERCKNCKESMVRIYWTIYYAPVQMTEYFGVSCTAVCRTAKQAEKEMTKNTDFKTPSLWPFKFHMEVR